MVALIVTVCLIILWLGLAGGVTYLLSLFNNKPNKEASMPNTKASVVTGLTYEQETELRAKVKELQIWLDRNCHPHMNLVITSTSAQLSEGIIGMTNDDLVD